MVTSILGSNDIYAKVADLGLKLPVLRDMAKMDLLRAKSRDMMASAIE